MSSTARRITLKARTAGLWEAISRGVTYPVVVDSSGIWMIYDGEGIGFATAGYQDAPDAARVRTAVREDLERLERGEVRLDLELAPVVEDQADAPAEDTAAEEFDAEAWREQYLADTTAPGLHWTARHLETVEHAATAGIVAEAGAYRRRAGGRRIAAALVDGLAGAGFLAAAEDGMVRATADGVEAARRIRLAPAALMTEGDWNARARRVNRALAHGRRAELLPCLPDGAEHGRRREAARKWWAEWDRQAAASRAEVESILARSSAQDAAAQARRAAEREAELDLAVNGCGQCPAAWVLEARCGVCRSASRPAPHQPEPQAAADVEQPAPTTTRSGRTYVTVSVFTDNGRTQARLEFPAARSWRAAEHRAVAAELARLYGLKTTAPRRLLADGTHTGAELPRRLDVVGAARTMDRYLAALPRVIARLENLATRAARKFGTWRRSLMAVLSGVLDDQSPAEVQRKARAYRSAVLARLISFMAQGPSTASDDARAPLWERVDAMAAEVWALAPVDPWGTPAPAPATADAPSQAADTTNPRTAPAATGQTVTLLAIDQPTPPVTLAA
ncbi:hypothetical protein [Streptomyces sp. NPDC001389]|uniref:hypothetical protein n=1 Tax=Streptomyces sp. NPDC001389 TaxID=3364569 RepID=UPI00368FCF44